MRYSKRDTPTRRQLGTGLGTTIEEIAEPVLVGIADRLSEIRQRCDNGEVRRVIAEDFGIDKSAVSLIGLRKNWSWLEERG